MAYKVFVHKIFNILKRLKTKDIKGIEAQHKNNTEPLVDKPGHAIYDFPKTGRLRCSGCSRLPVSL
jgi:hypothetical protein